MSAPLAAASEAVWLTPAQVGIRIRRNVQRVRKALEEGRMHGHQTCHGGRWWVKPESADAFVRGEDGREACGCSRLRLVANTSKRRART